jgi:hypothetical protein
VNQGSQPSTIWTPRGHNLTAKDVDEPHGNRQQRVSGAQLRAEAPARTATVAGAVILGTALVLSPALASCSARDCAYYGSPDANTRCVVISAPTTGGGK